MNAIYALPARSWIVNVLPDPIFCTLYRAKQKGSPAKPAQAGLLPKPNDVTARGAPNPGPGLPVASAKFIPSSEILSVMLTLSVLPAVHLTTILKQVIDSAACS